MNVIRTNRPNFFGNAGEPLQSGYIYIGQPNQDPTSFTKTVTFEDSQGNQFTAAQPLRTNAQGQVTYNGKAIISLVDGDYSMLILDSTQTQIEDGHTPLVEPEGDSGSTSDLTAYRENSLLLADVKKLVKAPGQTVRSIGKASTTDNLGADWLVESNTGSPADDVDLIDFDNGLQGTRIKNFTGEAQTAADKLAIRTNIDVYSKAEAAKVMSAYVSSAGALQKAIPGSDGKTISSITKGAAGRYTVNTSDSIDAVTMASPTDITTARMIVVDGNPLTSPNSAFQVSTFDSSGVLTNVGFTIHITYS